jgi:hypothetical protein
MPSLQEAILMLAYRINYCKKNNCLKNKQMENKIDPDRIRAFDPVLAELSTLHHRNEIYGKHLKEIRKFLWLALIVLSVLIYWNGERDRYRHVENFILLDTKTGIVYDSEGNRAN